MPQRPRPSSRRRAAGRSRLPATSATRSSASSAVEQTVGELGRLDVLVNNAGEQHTDKDIRDITEDQLRRTFQTNIFGMFFMTQAALPHLKKGAAIINMHVGDHLRRLAVAARLQRDQRRDRRLHPLARQESGQAGHPRERASRRGRSGLRSTRSAASRPRKFPSSARIRRWAGRASRTRLPLVPVPGVRGFQLHDRAGASPGRRQHNLELTNRTTCSDVRFGQRQPSGWRYFPPTGDIHALSDRALSPH